MRPTPASIERDGARSRRATRRATPRGYVADHHHLSRLHSHQHPADDLAQLSATRSAWTGAQRLPDRHPRSAGAPLHLRRRVLAAPGVSWRRRWPWPSPGYGSCLGGQFLRRADCPHPDRQRRLPPGCSSRRAGAVGWPGTARRSVLGHLRSIGFAGTSVALLVTAVSSGRASRAICARRRGRGCAGSKLATGFCLRRRRLIRSLPARPTLSQRRSRAAHHLAQGVWSLLLAELPRRLTDADLLRVCAVRARRAVRRLRADAHVAACRFRGSSTGGRGR